MNTQQRVSKRNRTQTTPYTGEGIACSHWSKQQKAAYAKKQKTEAAARAARNVAQATPWNFGTATTKKPRAKSGARGPSAAPAAAEPAPAAPPPSLTVNVGLARATAAAEDAAADQAAITINQAAQSPPAPASTEMTAEQQAMEEARLHHAQQLEADAQQERDRVAQEKKEREAAQAAQAAAESKQEKKQEQEQEPPLIMNRLAAATLPTAASPRAYAATDAASLLDA